VQNPRILIGADAALNVRASDEQTAVRILKSVDMSLDEEILGINVNAYLDTWAGPHIKPMGREKFVKCYTAALNRIGKELGVPMLFVCTQHLDVDITREIMAGVNTPPKLGLISNVHDNHSDVKAALARLALVFGMRLHCMILASSELTPVIGLAYQPKNDAYYTSLGLREYSMSFADFSEDALVGHIRSGWEKRAELKAHLTTRIPQLQQKAYKAAELVAAIHRGEDIDAAFTRLSD
jgi:polysaccharide pyruvyl transferase WcaK-like protein